MEKPVYKLCHHSRNFIAIVEAIFNLTRGVYGKKYPFDKEELLVATSRHIQGIRSIYDKINKEKVEVLEDFCVFALQTPNEIDDWWLEVLLQKHKDIEDIITDLQKPLKKRKGGSHAKK